MEGGDFLSLEKNKAIIRKYIEALNKRNLKVLDELMAPDYVDRALQVHGLEANKQAFTTTIKGLPDWHETVEDIVAEGDKVWLRFKGSGTHKGELRGVLAPSGALAPTGRKFKTISVEIYRILNGKIVEGWTILDWFTHLEFHKQQGLVEYKGYPEEGMF